MANIKSQKKRILTNEKARLRNNSVKSEIKTLTRHVDEAIEKGDSQTAQEAMKVVSRKIDKAVSKGVYHRNKAANKKSKIAHRVNKMNA
ncbi:MAG: 30S ribosomal protein S20 [Micrococcaceae bacterium]